MRILVSSLAIFLVVTPAWSQAGSSPVARVAVIPDSVIAGDTTRVRAEAYDAAGRRLDDVAISFGNSGIFEGYIDTQGVVHSYATGTLPVALGVTPPGGRRQLVDVSIRMVPGPIARIDLRHPTGRLVVGQRLNLDARSFSESGDPREDVFVWRSSNDAVVTVDANGRIRATGPGTAMVSASAGGVVAEVAFKVAAEQVASIEISPDLATVRQGDVVRLAAVARDPRGPEISGVLPTWSFSPGDGVVDASGAFVAYRPGEYLVTASFGDRSADALVKVTARDARQPVTVVGRLPRTRFSTEEVWVHPNGEVAYLGTGAGGDRMYAIDITDPTRPVVTDSLVADTRRVNDIMTTPDGRYLVHTREGASSRMNGIVIASLEDPRHPVKIAEFTDEVTAGVHSAFVAHQERYGTHVYLTNNGTNAMHVIDISDPYHPREVGRWRSPTYGAGGSLHDIDVQDGIAYLSNWNDNLVILDVGNGIKGGSPSNPQLITQYRYDLNELYRDVEVAGGPGFIRGTHTAWRHRDYVFIADEVFPAAAPSGTRDAAANRAYGDLQVIDVSDWDNPRSVAWYKPEDGGVHNVWIDGEILYMGAYTSGFRAFDISGELMGDLRAQGREIAHVNTADMNGVVPNQAMTWGVVVKNGLAYVNDNHNGLWIIRLEPRP